MLALVRAEAATGVSLVGFYHSHPDHEAQPSGTDLQEAAIGYIYMIQSVVIGSSGLLTAWQIEDESSGFVEVDVKIV
jgi:proteasome lid subunit RPN8/RPN11